jgi:phage-related protein
VEREINALPASLRSKLLGLTHLIEQHGLERLHEPYVKHIDGKLWELRAKASDGIARGFYVTISGQQVVILHVFAKKTQKTPPRAIALARERMKEVSK